jgi:hypothetical protein
LPVGAVVGAVTAVAGVGSALIGAKAAKDASQAQAKAAGTASDTTMKMYQQTRADLQPYAGTGKDAMTSIAEMYGLPTAAHPNGGQAFNPAVLENFTNSPDYQVALREGIRARDLSAASRGNLLSGGQIKASENYGSDLASLKFGEYMDRLYKLAGMGQNAAAGQGAAATQAGSSLSDLALKSGEAKAAGDVGVGNALSSGLTGLGTNLAYYAMKNPSAYGSTSPAGALY